MSNLSDFASVFLKLFDSHQFVPTDTDISSLSIDEAYHVQRMVIDRRIARGEQQAGYKVGCTSDAIRRQFGLTEPICGCVMVPYVHHGTTRLKQTDYSQPAVEPEFVVTISRDLPDEIGETDSLHDAIDFVSPGIELHNYKFRFGKPTLQELIASNGIHAALVIGEQRVSSRKIDWDMEGVGLFKGQQLCASGIAAEIMGGPMMSLRWLVNHLVRRGDMLKAGDVVIPGSPVELVPVAQGDTITARFTNVGQVQTTFV